MIDIDCISYRKCKNKYENFPILLQYPKDLRGDSWKIPNVTSADTEPFVTVLFVGDEERPTGRFPAAGYNFSFYHLPERLRGLFHRYIPHFSFPF
jgi:hypothetical protein